jgi:hypothetical protein
MADTKFDSSNHGLCYTRPVLGERLGNVDCLPGRQVPRGFYLVEFKLNYSLTLESEKDAKIANWKACQLAH